MKRTSLPSRSLLLRWKNWGLLKSRTGTWIKVMLLN